MYTLCSLIGNGIDMFLDSGGARLFKVCMLISFELMTGGGGAHVNFRSQSSVGKTQVGATRRRRLVLSEITHFMVGPLTCLIPAGNPAQV